jgi:hypothetical protein
MTMRAATGDRSPAVRAIAFYLPQFHPIPENDAWWRPGFTEWTNVVRARAAFPGHDQPQLPGELGFYDLRCRETRHQQAALARAHGLHGFCYYHYWFNGKLLLERPLLDLLDDPALDFPFCLCWANENWTRRWDGRDEEVLAAQDYPAYDPDAHMAWLSRALLDPRYVRVDGRPLFAVYRATDIPAVGDVIAAWRRSAVARGVGDLYVCAIASSHTPLEPEALTALGFDAVIEFEPNLRGVPTSRSLPEAPGMHLYSYRAIAEQAMARDAGRATTFPGVFPSWDNTARRGWRATVIQNDDPDLYQQWLETACARAMKNRPSERLVFINAWNEWAEGCHLEPDATHGRMFLEATAAGLGVPVTRASRPSGQAEQTVRTDIRLPLTRPIYIWGCGSAGQRVAANLAEADVPCSGFLDSDPAAWGREIAGRRVYAPASVLERLSPDAHSPFILIGSIAQDAIARDIERAGGRHPDHYAMDAAALTVRRAHLAVPPFIRVGTQERPTCPICGGTSFSQRREGWVCRRCQSTERTRLAAIAFCDAFDWAHPPLMESAVRQHLRVVHAADEADHVAALAPLVTYRRALTSEAGALDDADLVIVQADEPIGLEAWLERAAAALSVGGQLIVLSAPNARLLEPSAAAHGFEVGVMQRDWPRYAVGPATIHLCRRA